MNESNKKSGLFFTSDLEWSIPIRDVLTTRNYQIFTTCKLSEALNLLETNEIEITFIDLEMNPLEAENLLAELDLNPRFIIKIVIINSLKGFSLEKYEKLGVSRCMIKSFSPDLISFHLNTWISQLDEVKKRQIFEENYTLLFSHFRGAIIIADTNRQVIDCNPVCKELFGCTQKNLHEKNFSEVFADEQEYMKFDKALQLHKDDKEDFYQIIKYRRMNGEEFLGETGIFFRQDNHHNNLTYIIHIRDVTGKVKAEEELKIAFVKYKTLFNSIPLGITISDDTGQIIESNAIAEILLGLSEEMQTQRKIDSKSWKIIRPDGTDMPSEEFASVRALKENKRVENVEMGIIKYNDDITWINVSAAPLPLDGYGVIITYNDITQKKQTEEKLEESKALIHETGEMASVGGWEVDIQNQTVYWSDITRKIHEVPDDYLPTLEDALKFFPGDSGKKISAAVEEAIDEGKGYELELDFISAKGNQRWVKTLGTAIMHDGKCIRFYGTFQDITAQKKAELELAKYRKNLEELVKERTLELEQANRFLKEKNQDLEEMHKLFIGREFRIKELRNEVAALKQKLNIEI